MMREVLRRRFSRLAKEDEGAIRTRTPFRNGRT